MHREDRFVFSHCPYAINLDSLRTKPPQEGFRHVWASVEAVWFRRKNGATAACVGFVRDYQDPTPRTAAEFLAAVDERTGRYGGNCRARWDGKSFWCAGQDPEENARFLELLKPMLVNYPAVPEGFDGWWVF